MLARLPKQRPDRLRVHDEHSPSPAGFVEGPHTPGQDIHSKLIEAGDEELHPRGRSMDQTCDPRELAQRCAFCSLSISSAATSSFLVHWSTWVTALKDPCAHLDGQPLHPPRSLRRASEVVVDLVILLASLTRGSGPFRSGKKHGTVSEYRRHSWPQLHLLSGHQQL